MVTGLGSKPNAPMRRAHRAKDLVTVGKLTTEGQIPVTADLYHALPSALIKPKGPKNLASTGVNNYTHMKPIDYIGLDLIVTASCVIATNWLFRIYF